MPRWINIANLFTFSRLVAAPFAVHAILTAEHQRALVIVLIAAVTDTVDGTLARRFGMMTSVGAYFDPIVDKLFLSAVYISLAMISRVPWWLVIVIFSRDVVILASSGTLLLLNRMHRFPPSVWGKASTFLQIGCALAIMVNNASPTAGAARWPEALIPPVAALTAFSGFHYVWRGLRTLRTEGRAAARLVSTRN